ncbi:ATAXIA TELANGIECTASIA MUTATED ATM -RELATED [Salix koriyanagi]|uniref:ATAXIA TELANGIECTASIA MUTATED ATM -RELATED n=1 Tax=Salix koriyanagi TaxID=2511006 RepID=A0A9Q0WB74_9ROSI|nr:ATAXIA TELANGIECTASIA MUTATED ATM -RELATED [Salix koriyanagi]
MTDGDVPSQSNDGFNPGSAGTDSKRAVDGSTFPEDASKRVKVEPGLQSICVMSPGGALSIPNIETPGPGVQPDEEFKPNAAMEEMIINFLIRVALVIEAKDKEATTMYKQALELLSQALESKDPSTALAQGLDVMNKVLEKQPHLFIRNNINQISQILEPCFKQKMLDAGK